MRVINLTPHAIALDVDGQRVVYPASGMLARCATRSVVVGVGPGGATMSAVEYGEVSGLPEAQADTMYIVSGLVRSALGTSRPDVVSPDSGPTAIRENGQVVAVRGWVGVA